MLNNNQHLAEVMCGMRFDPKTNDWDSTFYGRFHEKILGLGYTEKQERKEIEFQILSVQNQTHSDVKETASKMIFKNPVAQSAIMLGAHYVSFHKLQPYSDWNSLIEKIAKPALKLYNELGLGKNIQEVQCLYLNKFELKHGETPADYFNFLPSIEKSTETNISFQGKYDYGVNKTVQITLRGSSNNERERNDFFFECSCYTRPTANEEAFVLANQAHDEANSVFEKIYKNDSSNRNT